MLFSLTEVIGFTICFQYSPTPKMLYHLLSGPPRPPNPAFLPESYNLWMFRVIGTVVFSQECQKALSVVIVFISAAVIKTANAQPLNYRLLAH